jgi:hypothetical protein
MAADRRGGAPSAHSTFPNAVVLSALDRITRIMPELALNHDQRHAFVRHLNRVSVPPRRV